MAQLFGACHHQQSVLLAASWFTSDALRGKEMQIACMTEVCVQTGDVTRFGAQLSCSTRISDDNRLHALAATGVTTELA